MKYTYEYALGQMETKYSQSLIHNPDFYHPDSLQKRKPSSKSLIRYLKLRWTLTARNLKMTIVKLWAIKIMNLSQVSHCHNRSRHPHSVAIQSVQVQAPLLKHHTDLVHLMSPKKMNRMN
jgi:hypothetical protein